MARNMLFSTLMFTVMFAFASAAAWAIPYTVTVDISSIAGSDFVLDFELFDDDFIIGNTSVLIDNVFISDVCGVLDRSDFETGTFEGFIPDYIDPSTANIVFGGFTGSNYSLQIDEGSGIVSPVLTSRFFLGSAATTLQFDFELITSSSIDSVVAYIRDPDNFFDPFPSIPDLYGFGDILEAVNGCPPFIPQGVTAEPIPEPSSLLLILSALCGVIAYRGLGSGRKKP
jgi:hypothetical protein